MLVQRARQRSACASSPRRCGSRRRRSARTARRSRFARCGERVERRDAADRPASGARTSPSRWLLLDAAGEPYRDHARATRARAAPAIRFPGRFQRVGQWIFDVAHNPDGARTLAATARASLRPEPLTALLGVLADKDWRAMMRRAAPSRRRVHRSRDAPTAPAERAGRSTRWRSSRVAGVESPSSVADFDAALRARRRSRGGTTLVTGSFHTVGDAMARLQVSPFAG